MARLVDERPVVRVIARGEVTSFRYPHFVQQTHPTFPLPPPATIYGHLASALGEYPDPGSIAFGYWFSSDGEFADFEHIHLMGKEPKLNPFVRKQLFRPELWLYLDVADRDQWIEALRRPRYAVCLGRSQDLMTYLAVDEIVLRRAERGYFERTIVPASFAARLGGAMTQTMPRYLSPERDPSWQAYGILRRTGIWPPLPGEEPDTVVMEGDDETIWVDPSAPRHPRHPEIARAVVFHRFIDPA